MKVFLPFNTATVIVRNDTTMTLQPIKQSKGSGGTFPGLLLSEFKLETFKSWFAKNKEVDKDNTLNTFLCDSFNELSQLLWKDTVSAHDIEIDTAKYKTKEEKEKRPVPVVSDEVYKTLVSNFTEYLHALLNGERSKERDSKYFFEQFNKLSKQFKDEKDPVKKAELRTLAIEAKKTGDELQKAEDAATQASFEAMMNEK